MSCYCGQDTDFDKCCGLFIAGAAKPSTAEELMRSRFSAYAVGSVEYLVRSVHPSNREFHRAENISSWASANEWLGLEIVTTEKGLTGDKTGIVEFKAFYRDAGGAERIHHERSNFQKVLGKWFFVDGEVFETAPR